MTTRSPNGLTQLDAAISNLSSTGPAALEQITPGGFTIFAPVDDAWTSFVMTQLADSNIAPSLVGNHVRLDLSSIKRESGCLTN